MAKLRRRTPAYLLGGFVALYMVWSLGAGTDRNSVLVQLRALAQPLAGLLDPLVGRRRRLARAQPHLPGRARAVIQTRVARRGNRGAAGRRARDLPQSLARRRLAARQPVGVAAASRAGLFLAVSLFVLLTGVTKFIPLGTTAQVDRPGHVLTPVRDRDHPRPARLDPDHLRGGGARPGGPALQDLRAGPRTAAGARDRRERDRTFAISIDDFVITQYMSSTRRPRRRSRC